MIRFFHIENFKSLRKVGFRLAELNLFFGMNGMGKSSVLQALILLRQSYWNNNKSHLMLYHTNGSIMELGGYKDVLNENRDSDYLRYDLTFNNGIGLDISYEPQPNQLNTLRSTRPYGIDKRVADEALFSRGFCYLGAEHCRPKIIYDTKQWDPEGINPLGDDGRYAVPYLALHSEDKVEDRLCHPEARSNRLVDQVNAWMGEISPKIKLNPIYDVSDDTAKLWISYRGYDGLESESYSPINTGFGIPYVLPLLVALLTSHEEDLLLIENPESHLHPRGQSSIARLIARTAETGVQIICESHSDHIINGIRVAIKNNELKHDAAQIAFFSQTQNQEAIVTEIEVDRNGSLSEYPFGFLDEWGMLMADLIG